AVVRASKFTLRRVFKTFNVKKSNDFVQTHLVDEGRLYLDEFLWALIRQLADEMPSCVVKCLHSAVNYLHCARDEIKPHAALLLGVLYSELYRIREKYPEDTELDPDITRSARTRLLTLIKEPSAQASKFTLRRVFKTFNVKKSNDFVQTHLVDEGRLYLDEFLWALIRQLADEMPSCVVKCLHSAVNYLHCARDEIKPHAALLLGVLYSELYRIREKYPEDTELDPDITRSARTRLLTLIKEPSAQVRQNAAMALANICLVSAMDG
ncbi:jg19167, partial [Pararge aegeria aegeria]